MIELVSTSAGRFRLLAWLEGASLLALVAVAMPLKYWAGMPEATRGIGLVHGLLFVAYVFALLERYGARALTGRQALTGFGAAFVPLGTIVFDARLRRRERAAP